MCARWIASAKVPTCWSSIPMNAIYAEEDVPGDQIAFIKLNVELSQQAGWKSITKRKPAPADADEWKDKAGKIALLVR
jgi:ferredoxin